MLCTFFQIRKIDNLFLASSVKTTLFVLKTLIEPFLEERELRDEISDGVHEGVVGGVVRGGLDPQHNLVFHRVWVLVAGKQNIRVLQQLLPAKWNWIDFFCKFLFESCYESRF